MEQHIQSGTGALCFKMPQDPFIGPLSIHFPISRTYFACGPNDIRNGNPTPLFGLFLRYPNVQFDIFHIAYPYQKELVSLAKLYPNVFVNMAWVHSISPKSSVEFLLECIDTLPSNKVIGFGGDTSSAINVFGHLTLARQNISTALSQSIESKILSSTEAERYMEQILYKNPKKLYNF